MQKLTKTQVLALFLSSASASVLTPATLLNGPSSADRVPTLKDKEGAAVTQKLTPEHSATACEGNAGCTQDFEVCAYFQMAEGDSSNLCVNEDWCKAMGKLNGVAFNMQCWATPEEGITATQPADVKVADYFSQMELFITKAPRDESWKDAKNLLVSPKFNFQDGWYIEHVNSVENMGESSHDASKTGQELFYETDKPKDNRCFDDDGCDAGECCGTWPDQNNRRCFKKDQDGVEQFAGPVKFTPACIKEDKDAVPENAQDDIAKGARAEAAEALGKFYDEQVKDAKIAAKYDDMSAEDQKAWDEKRTALDAKRKEFFDELKKQADFDGDKCDDLCKTAIEEKILEFGRDKYKNCAEDEKAITCREADKLFKEKFTAMLGGGEGEKNFFTEMDKEAREKFESGFAEKAEKAASALAAAWLKDNAAPEGTPGGKCRAAGGDKPVCDVGSCCGTSVPQSVKGVADQVTDAAKDGINKASEAIGVDLGVLGGLVDTVSGAVQKEVAGQLNKVCAKSADQKVGVWTNELGEKFDHTCLAQRLMATAAASLAAAYSLM